MLNALQNMKKELQDLNDSSKMSQLQGSDNSPISERLFQFSQHSGANFSTNLAIIAPSRKLLAPGVQSSANNKDDDVNEAQVLYELIVACFD